MNFGINDIEIIIFNQFKQGKCKLVGYPYKKFVKDLAKKIYERVEENMHTDIELMAKAKGIPDEIISMCKRAEKAFNFDNMNLKVSDQDVYKWLIEQDVKGQTIEKFVEWARGAERAQYIRKYRNNTGDIKNDWALAFGETKGYFEDVEF